MDPFDITPVPIPVVIEYETLMPPTDSDILSLPSNEIESTPRPTNNHDQEEEQQRINQLNSVDDGDHNSHNDEGVSAPPKAQGPTNVKDIINMESSQLARELQAQERIKKGKYTAELSQSSPPSDTVDIPSKPISPSTWRGVPRDVLSLIAAHLDTPSFIQFGQTDREAHVATSSDQHWLEISRRPWVYFLPELSESMMARGKFDQAWNSNFMKVWKTEINTIDPNKQPREYCKQRRLYALEMYHRYQRLYNLAVQDEQANPVGNLMHFIFQVCETPMIAIWSTVFVILLVIQLDSSSAITLWSLWPMLLLIGYLALSILFYGLTNFFPVGSSFRTVGGLVPSDYSYSHPSDGFIWGMLDWLTLKRFANRMDEMNHTYGAIEPYTQQRIQTQRKHMVLGTLVIMMSIVFLLFLLFGLLRSSGSIEWNWFIVFIPTYVFCAIATFFVPHFLLSRAKNESSSTSICCTLVFTLPLLAFLLMLPIRLEAIVDGSTHPLSLTSVFIPLWIIDSIIILSSFVLFVVMTSGDSSSLTSRRMKRYFTGQSQNETQTQTEIERRGTIDKGWTTNKSLILSLSLSLVRVFVCVSLS